MKFVGDLRLAVSKLTLNAESRSAERMFWSHLSKFVPLFGRPEGGRTELAVVWRAARCLRFFVAGVDVDRIYVCVVAEILSDNPP